MCARLRGLAVVILCGICALSCQNKSHSNEAGPRCLITQDDYAVFTAVLDGLPNNYPKEAQYLKGKEPFVLAETEPPPSLSVDNWKYYDFGSTAPSHETETDFRVRAERSCQLHGSLPTKQPSRLILTEEVSRIFKSEGGWKTFYKKFPNSIGILTFSLPGYNSQHTEAVVVMANSCGDGCAGQALVLLKKDSGRWTVEKHLVDLME